MLGESYYTYIWYHWITLFICSPKMGPIFVGSLTRLLSYLIFMEVLILYYSFIWGTVNKSLNCMELHCEILEEMINCWQHSNTKHCCCFFLFCQAFIHHTKQKIRPKVHTWSSFSKRGIFNTFTLSNCCLTCF